MSNYFLKPKPIPCSPLLLPRSARRSCGSLLGAAALHRKLFPTDAAAALRPPPRHDRLFLPGHQGNLQPPWDQAQVARRHPWELVLPNLPHWSRRCRQLPCTRRITSSKGSDDPRRPSECPLLWSSRTTRSSRPHHPRALRLRLHGGQRGHLRRLQEKPGHRKTDRRTPTWPSWSARLCPQLPPPWGSTELNVDLTEFQTNLVPCPRSTSSWSPMPLSSALRTPSTSQSTTL